MKRYVVTHNRIEGTHYWKDAPQLVGYLKNEHRHIFHIRCEFAVKGLDREIEVILQQNKIRNYVKDKYGDPALFGGMSCEMISEEILKYFPECRSCEVLEDGFGGARIEK